MAAHAQEPVGQGIRLLAGIPAHHNAPSRASQIFYEHDPQRDRDCPQFADRQRLNALIGTNESAKHLRIETAVCMGDEGPSYAEHPRISGERPDRQFR